MKKTLGFALAITLLLLGATAVAWAEEHHDDAAQQVGEHHLVIKLGNHILHDQTVDAATEEHMLAVAQHPGLTLISRNACAASDHHEHGGTTMFAGMQPFHFESLNADHHDGGLHFMPVALEHAGEPLVLDLSGHHDATGHEHGANHVEPFVLDLSGYHDATGSEPFVLHLKPNHHTGAGDEHHAGEADDGHGEHH